MYVCECVFECVVCESMCVSVLCVCECVVCVSV